MPVARVQTLAELREALPAAGEVEGPVAVHVETDRYAGVPGYGGWWEVPPATISESPEVRAARRRYEADRRHQRSYAEGT